jgi:hypothetical protein
MNVESAFPALLRESELSFCIDIQTCARGEACPCTSLDQNCAVPALVIKHLALLEDSLEGVIMGEEVVLYCCHVEN